MESRWGCTMAVAPQRTGRFLYTSASSKVSEGLMPEHSSVKMTLRSDLVSDSECGEYEIPFNCRLLFPTLEIQISELQNRARAPAFSRNSSVIPCRWPVDHTWWNINLGGMDEPHRLQWNWAIETSRLYSRLYLLTKAWVHILAAGFLKNYIFLIDLDYLIKVKNISDFCQTRRWIRRNTPKSGPIIVQNRVLCVFSGWVSKVHTGRHHQYHFGLEKKIEGTYKCLIFAFKKSQWCTHETINFKQWCGKTSRSQLVGKCTPGYINELIQLCWTVDYQPIQFWRTFPVNVALKDSRAVGLKPLFLTVLTKQEHSGDSLHLWL